MFELGRGIFSMLNQSRGISLIEVLVSLLIASILIFAITTLFSNTMTSSQRVMDQGRLDRDLQAAVDAMVLDIQRAGFWANATNSNTNPFMATGLDITTNSSNDCVTFTYDRNNDGTVAPISSSTDDEHYGFRKNGDVLQYRPPGTATDCALATDWGDLTNSNAITITAFSVTTTNTPITIDTNSTDTTIARTVTVSVTGHLTNDTNATKTITRTIKVYNNKYSP